ncbi:MAG: hypothetical protein JWP00_624 [Chloroflexi bacterium]|nr:hypothetical protein [Chloroflexota bacterium]
MSNNRDTELLLQSGISAVRSGDKREGARLLAQVVRKEPQSEEAWFWLAAATDQPAEAAACLRRVLAINPNNGRARQALNMLDTGQGQAAFSTGPLETNAPPDFGNRPLSTGDLISPYNPPAQPAPAPTPPPPPPFGGGNVYTGETTIPAQPQTPPPFSWPPNNGDALNDPYNVNTMPSPPPGNTPPPPPFMGGGGVRLGQLDPSAPGAQNIPAAPAPYVSDPGAELRASLLPNTPVNGAQPPYTNGPVPVKRGIFRRRKTVVVQQDPALLVKKKRRLNPLFLVLSILVIFLASLIGFLLMQQQSPATVAVVTAADQTATAAALTATVSGGTPIIPGTPGAAVIPGAGTPGAVTSGDATAANGTPGTGSSSGTAGTPGASGSTNATAGVGTLPAGQGGTAQAGQPTPTAQGGTLPASGTGTQTGPTPTTAPGSVPGTGSNGGEFPGATPGTIPAGTGPDVPPPNVRDNRPPPEIVIYVNKTATYLNNAQFFEAAVAEGIVKPYRAGRIKPGVTLINLAPIRVPGSSLNLISPVATASSGTPAPAPTTTPNPTAIAPATPRPNTPNNGNTGVPGSGDTAQGTISVPNIEPTSPPNATPAPTRTPAPAAATPAATPSGIPAEALPVVINGPNGPEVVYLINFSGGEQMSRLSLSLGQIARILKDQPVPVGGYELNQVSLEYANDIAYMANSLDRFFQTGQLSHLEDLANYYDKAVRDRERWAKIVNAGYPFRIIL